MLTTKIRTPILTAVAALSVLSAGTFTSVASARMPRKEVKIGQIEAECSGKTAGGAIAWFPEGTVITLEDPVTHKRYRYECKGGDWWHIAQEAVGQPKTTQEALPGPLPINPGSVSEVAQPATNQERPSTTVLAP